VILLKRFDYTVPGAFGKWHGLPGFNHLTVAVKFLLRYGKLGIPAGGSLVSAYRRILGMTKMMDR
jgi:hypothetical protein